MDEFTDRLRSWNVSKTRDGKPKITLYEDGRKVLEQRVSSVVKGNRFGRAWGESNGASS